MKRFFIFKQAQLFFLFLSFITFSSKSKASNLTDRVLVLKNINSPVSMAVAADYMQRRNVTNVLAVTCQNSESDANLESIDFANFKTEIETPLINYLALHPQIDFIVLTKGIPIRIYNMPNKPYGGLCCLDSYLASLTGYNNVASTSIINISDINYGVDFVGDAFINRYFNSNLPFSHNSFGGYLVSRLDGYTQADAIALTTRSILAEQNAANNITNSGKILLDTYAPWGFPNLAAQPYTLLPANYTPGQNLFITSESSFGEFNSDMQIANDYLVTKSIPVMLEATAAFTGNINNLNGYVSWGSNDPNYTAGLYTSLNFAAGAIAETGVSTGGRTFLPTTGGQSLIVDLIAQGVTGVKGYTDEPLLQAIASPSILFNRYTRGWTMAESFYAASRLVGWMDIVIGDPICRAYNLYPLSVQNALSENASCIYPNPSENIINAHFQKNIIASKIFVLNTLGQTLLEFPFNENATIDIYKLKTGMYFLKTNAANANIFSFTKK